jgi:hypothetical protein
MEEGEIVTADSLREEWSRVLSMYDMLIDNRHKLRPIRFIIRHIIDHGYDSTLFPGTSLYSLLISIPTNNKVNYNKTLQIGFDQRTETLKFTFSDSTGWDRQTMDIKKRIKWRETCQATEGTSLLEFFLTDNVDFRNAVKGISAD